MANNLKAERYVHNIELIRGRSEKKLDEGLDYIRRQVGNLYRGWTGPLVNTMIKNLYCLLAEKDVRERAFNRLNIVLKCAQEGDGIEEFIEEYVKNDEMWRRRNPEHAKVAEMEDILEKMLDVQVDVAKKLLNADGGTYDELVIDAFPDREDLERCLQKQFELNKKVISMVEDNGLVKLRPIIKRETILLLKKGEEYLEKDQKTELDRTYKSLT